MIRILAAITVCFAFSSLLGCEQKCTTQFDCDVGETCNAGECVVVPVDDPLRIIGFAANPPSIERGETSRLIWEIEGADVCTLDSATVACDGNLDVTPLETTTYRLNGIAGVGTSGQEVEVVVIQPRSDAGPNDAGVVADSGTADGGVVDGGPNDAGGIDAGPVDAGISDGGIVDAGQDGGAVDAGPNDGGLADGGLDAGPPFDAGPIGPNVRSLTASFTTCAVVEDDVYCWGANQFGQLGTGDALNSGDDAGERAVLIALGNGQRFRQVSSVGGHVCARGSAGTLRCWGRNSNGQLGLGDTENRGDDLNEMGLTLPFIDLGADVVSIASGGLQNCALLTGGEVKCWGDNRFGFLGLGDQITRGDEPDEMGDFLPSVDLGFDVVALGDGCAILVNGSVKCWGSNIAGRLGLEEGQATRGEGPGEMGTNLPAISLDLVLPVRATQLSTGLVHVCVVTSEKKAKCWGSNESGKLGIGDSTSRGAELASMGAALPYLDLDGDVEQISAGGNHTCAVLTGGIVKCWGDNESGQLGLGDVVSRGDQSGEMGASLPAVELGLPAKIVVAGFLHTCAVLVNNAIKCWGDNQFGQLGLGDTNNRGDDPNEMGAFLPAVSFP